LLNDSLQPENQITAERRQSSGFPGKKCCH